LNGCRPFFESWPDRRRCKGGDEYYPHYHGGLGL
jgi:diadenosine tetraphosphatase ApaH/serine/threonine PP2A family protein phosphatase